MSSIIVKAIYLLTSAFLGIGSVKHKRLKNKPYLMLALCIAMAHCFAFWGISTIFHLSEGYPPQWFFYFTSTPVFLVSIAIILNIEKS